MQSLTRIIFTLNGSDMVSQLYKKYAGRLEEAYREKPIFIHKNGTVESIEYFKYAKAYQVTCYGVNPSGVPYTGCVIERKGKHVFWFTYCGSHNEDLARFCAEHINNLDELRRALYE